MTAHLACSAFWSVLFLLHSLGGLWAQTAPSTLPSAAERSDVTAVSLLIAQHVDVNTTDDVGATALDWACRHNDVNLVRMLLAAGANPNLELIQPIVSLPPGSPPWAAPPDPNHRRFPARATPLTLTTSADIVAELIAARADVNRLESATHMTPLLFFISRWGDPIPKATVLIIAKELLDAGAHASEWEGPNDTALHLLAIKEAGDEILPEAWTLLKYLLNAGAPIDPIDSLARSTPLLLAARLGHFGMVKALVNLGANRNQRDGAGNTVVDVAQQNHFESIAHFMSELGVSAAPSRPQQPVVSPSPVGNTGNLDDSHYICPKTSPGRAPSTVGAHLNFGSRSWLSVKTNDPDGLLPDQSRLALANDIGRAMVIWRRVCTHCVPGNLSVLRIDEDLYIDGIIAGPLRSGDLNNIEIGPTPPSVPLAPGKSLVILDVITALLASRYGTRTVMVQFEKISRNDPLFANACSVPFDRLPDLFRSTRLALGCPDDQNRAHPSPAELSIYVLNGYTSCGRNKDIIGCSADDLVVELNARDFRFQDSETALFGLGTRVVDLFHVMLHEFGHWIGLPHLSTDGNIMSPSLPASRCIDDADISALDALVEGDTDRRKGKGALYYSIRLRLHPHPQDP